MGEASPAPVWFPQVRPEARPIGAAVLPVSGDEGGQRVRDWRPPGGRRRARSVCLALEAAGAALGPFALLGMCCLS